MDSIDSVMDLDHLVSIAKPYLNQYDSETHVIDVSYDYNSIIHGIIEYSSFFDSSVPQKLVQFQTVETEVFKLEFSTDNVDFQSILLLMSKVLQIYFRCQSLLDA